MLTPKVPNAKHSNVNEDFAVRIKVLEVDRAKADTHSVSAAVF